VSGMEIIAAAGLALSAAATAASSMQASGAASAQASALEQQASDERAAAAQEARGIRKDTEGLLARQQQLGAASGTSLASPDLMKLSADTGAEGELQAQQQQYLGEVRANDLQTQARNTRMQGRNRMYGGLASTAGSLALGGATLYSRMNPVEPQTGYNRGGGIHGWY
jgi:hypothetical protein